ncbi:adhesion G protein-coupled receptor E2-like [Periophthalmus magnuspinnatus]|uniref:adhesion G protein-coupled receptor E2-like n=1 Tax=Periophthalmus magnuspinnatus TaxID=409849 RepID=UPI002436BB4D|nr:adhesion G protein-coupled receptor E2-like [Periophthalmus magnuspinnatus]
MTPSSPDAYNCIDIDECLNEMQCGPNATCTNTPGLWSCACDTGFRVTDDTQEPSPSNPCVDIDECVNETLCVPNAVCINSPGLWSCVCDTGFRTEDAAQEPSPTNLCVDINECTETPDVCGPLSICFNKFGTYNCACSDGHFSSTGIIWTEDSVCKNVTVVLDELSVSEGQTKEMAFFAFIDEQVKESKGDFLTEAMLVNIFAASMEIAGVGPFVSPPRVNSTGDGVTGSIILDITERLMSSLLQHVGEKLTLRLNTSTFDLNLVKFGPGVNKSKRFPLTANGNIMEINMESLAENNNGWAAAVFLSLSGMDSLLSHLYFQSENQATSEFASDVFTAFLPTMNNTNLTEPVNFTIQHNRMTPDSGSVTCVYWKVDIEPIMKTLRGEEEKKEEPATLGWSEEGCWVSYTDPKSTVCSCSHLSTFALILQIGEPPPPNDFLVLLNRICVAIGLFFFVLAILTFLLCSWNPKINNSARLHLCLNLGLSHLLLLLSDLFVNTPAGCKAVAIILHFLVVSSFVWMQLEAIQLFLLVRGLNKVRVIQRDGLPKPALFAIGYGVPTVIVGISAAVYHPGYGLTEAEVCWLSTTRNFNWALTGPVIAILAMNCALFFATLWSLRTILANMKSGASESKDAKLVLFKILAQFVILGCTWILGLYQTDLILQILFIVFNSQQGTFLYIVHCLLNREIREECLKYLTCSHNKSKNEKDALSVSEDLDK